MPVASLACFVHYLRDKGNKVTIEGDEEEFVNEILNYSHSTPNASCFGLWRIEEAWKDSIYKSLFDFPGTLLFYEISLENYDDEEIINEFEW